MAKTLLWMSSFRTCLFLTTWSSTPLRRSMDRSSIISSIDLPRRESSMIMRMSPCWSSSTSFPISLSFQLLRPDTVSSTNSTLPSLLSLAYLRTSNFWFSSSCLSVCGDSKVGVGHCISSGLRF